jgi:hypothetical protein
VTIEQIDKTMNEARRFMELAADVLGNCTHRIGEHVYLDTGKKTGALRRASMDLTRALAEMRKP